MSNYIPYKTVAIITYTCSDLSQWKGHPDGIPKVQWVSQLFNSGIGGGALKHCIGRSLIMFSIFQKHSQKAPHSTQCTEVNHGLPFMSWSLLYVILSPFSFFVQNHLIINCIIKWPGCTCEIALLVYGVAECCKVIYWFTWYLISKPHELCWFIYLWRSVAHDSTCCVSILCSWNMTVCMQSLVNGSQLDVPFQMTSYTEM